MKKIFSLLMMSVLAIGASWAQVYTHNFSSGDLSDDGNPAVLSDVSWNETYEWNGSAFFTFDKNATARGLQVGSSKKSCKGFSLSTTGITGTITSVKVNASGASKVNATLEVLVGGTSWGINPLTSAATDYSFTGNGSGEVTIKYSQPSTLKALYIKSIEITYTTTGETKQPAGLAYETTSFTAMLGDTFATPMLTNPNNLTVTYSSSDAAVATVDAATGEVTLVGAGTTTITAESAETDTYYAGKASYELTVNAPVVTETNLDYAETFTTDMGSFTIEDKTNPLPAGMTYVWNHGTFNGTGFMKASGYAKKVNNAVESWLISPTIHLLNADGTKPDIVEMSFDQAINAYFGDVTAETSVKIEVDGNWTKLEVSYPAAPAGGYTEFQNNKIDLSQYTGKTVKIAFVYSSTETNAGTWEVNNFSVKGSNVPTGVDENVASKAVTGVKYYNLAGVESSEPFDGVNIVKTTYTDGTTKATKILK